MAKRSETEAGIGLSEVLSRVGEKQVTDQWVIKVVLNMKVGFGHLDLVPLYLL